MPNQAQLFRNLVKYTFVPYYIWGQWERITRAGTVGEQKKNCSKNNIIVLFDLEPDLLPLFQYNCKKFSTPEECLSSPEFLEHVRKVMLVIDAAVTHLENLHCLEEYLANLGKKHQAVGVKVESFSAVGESLLYMLEKCHGPAFSLNVREAWTRLYSAVVKAMSCGWDVPGKVG
ncbi:UNVERIFIED_CONTAM: hypothetical protein K2H54_038252 [Gekko kuhli]